MGPEPLGKSLDLSFRQKQREELEMIWIMFDTTFKKEQSDSESL